MKPCKTLVSISFSVVILTACKKDNINTTPLSSLEIVNANATSPGAQLNSNPNAVSYGSYGQFSLLAGNSSAVYVYPTGDSLHPYYNKSLDAANGSIYSMYLTSDPQGGALLMKDTIPTYVDSSMGIRFINLSSDAGSISINILGANNGSTVSSLAYKSITSFKTFLATADINNNGGYNFEIRDSGGNLLYTFNQSTVVFKNITIVINGLVGNGSLGVFTVNNY